MESRKPATKDYYAILGVPPDAAPGEIKKAYRTLAQRYHPDRVSAESESSIERMVEINEAFAVVSDRKRRTAYDRERAAPIQPAPAPEPDPLETQPFRTTVLTPRNLAADRSVIQDFLAKLKTAIAKEGAPANLKEEPEKPWLWSFSGRTWVANYSVSLRVCPLLNPGVARESITQAEAVVHKRRSGWKSNFSLFILAFEALNEGETVLKILRTYCNLKENSTQRNLVNLIVLDLNQRRSVLCGKRTREENLDRILSALSIS